MTITATETLTGREYLRVSADKSDHERSNEDQHEDNADTAADFNITLGKPYRDVGSASRFAIKERDDFARLMRDLETGEFGADVLQMWEGSRGSRKPREWLDLIDACRAKGVKILITTHRRIYDLEQWRDRHTLQEESLKAAASSEETSERVTRTLTRNAEKGRPHGICPYGYMRTYTKVRNSKGRLVTRPDEQLPEPSEALNVIDMFLKLRGGHSFASIEASWAEKGITSRDGVPFSAQSMSQMARKISYVGKRAHKGTEIDASWPVIADFEGSPITPEDFVVLFEDVQRILKDSTRRTNPGGGAKHVFTMTIRCDVCGGPMTATEHLSGEYSGPAYVCRDGGCTRIRNKAALDDLLTSEILALLSDPDVYQRLGSGDDGGTELGAVRAELARKRADLEETRNAETETLAEEKRLARREERLETEVKQLEGRERELTRPSPLADLFPGGPAETVAARWEATPIGAQRAIAALLLSPELLGQVRVKRVADSASETLTDRLKWVQS